MECMMSTEHSRKSPNIKGTDETDTKNLMDVAPLFAGLDGFVLSQAVKIETETPLSDKPKTIKEKQPRQKKQATTAGPVPERVPKIPRAPSTDSGAVLLTVTEMCNLLNISRATLVRMDKSGKLPGRIKLGGSVRFHRATVETWLQSLISPLPSP
jgi:excisionase family DNA binding protein